MGLVMSPERRAEIRPPFAHWPLLGQLIHEIISV